MVNVIDQSNSSDEYSHMSDPAQSPVYIDIYGTGRGTGLGRRDLSRLGDVDITPVESLIYRGVLLGRMTTTSQHVNATFQNNYFHC